MNMRVTGSYPAGLTSPVDKRIGDAFPIVEGVYKHLKELTYLAHHADKLTLRQIQLRANLKNKSIEWRYEGKEWLLLCTFDELTQVDLHTLEDVIIGYRNDVERLLNNTTKQASQAASLVSQANALNQDTQAQAATIYFGSHMYLTVEAGLAATQNGEYFLVPESQNGDFLATFYRNNSGVPKEISKINSDEWGEKLKQQVDRAEQKLREFVSVKDFGAVGDGVTDDTAAIQAAIDAAALLGKSVLVGGTAASYLCGPLSISASLVGENRKTSKLTRKTGTTGPWLNITANAVSVSDLYLNGAYVAARCIEVDGYDDVVITNNIARQIGEYFVHFNNADRLVVSFNDYKDGSNGIANLMPVDSVAAAGSIDVKIIGNHIENILGTAIHFAGKQSTTDPLFAWSNPLVTNGVISNNTINKVNGSGIIAQSYYLEISNNTIRAAGSSGGNQGIVPQGKYISVVGNVIDGGSGVGIDMGGCNTSTVAGNIIRRQAEIGIELQSCVNTTCVGNSVVDCGFGITGDASAGIAVLQGFFGPSLVSANNVVSGNTVISAGSSGEYGVSVGAGVTECIVTGNNLVNSGTVKQLFVSATANALVYGNATGNGEEDLFVIYGETPRFVARNAAGNADFWMQPQGTGQLRVQKYMGTAATPGNFMAVSFLPIKDEAGNVFYIPLATATW